MIDAVEIAATRERREQQEADYAARRRESTEAAYANLLARADCPEADDASELAQCIDALNLRPDDVRRDQAAIAEFRRQVEFASRRAAAAEALKAANAAKETTERRHKQEAEDALRACVRARHELYDCSNAKSQLTNLADRHPRLAAAFESLRGD